MANANIFVIEDDVHAELCGEFSTFQEALSELGRRAKIAWNEDPNLCPCTSWETCSREYMIVEYNVTSPDSWKKVNEFPALSVSAKGTFWDKNLER